MKLNMEKINPIYRDITITKSGVFNENGNDSYESQMLIGGNPTGIANMNTVRHQWAVNIYNTMLANFWIPQTVDMTDDKRTKTSLTKDEERATYDTLGFLIFMDSFQVANLPNIAEVFTAPIIKMCLKVKRLMKLSTQCHTNISLKHYYQQVNVMLFMTVGKM